MATRSTTKDATFYLYVGSQWTGPYPVSDIRKYLHDGRVAADTYAYDPYEQRHSTVGELLAEASGGEVFSAPTETTGSGSGSRGTSSLEIHDLEEPEYAAASTSTVAFDGIEPNLRAFYHAYLDLAEDRGTDTGTALATLRRCHRDIATALAIADAHREAMVSEIERVADYLANRHQEPRLWDLLATLRETPSGEIDATASAAADIVNHLVVLGEQHGAGSEAHRSDGTTRRIINSAANEINSTQRDLEAIQKAYAALQERHAQDLEQARELLTKVESSRDDEGQARTQSEAEVRALAAEVHRLAGEVAEANHDTGLVAEVERLGADLREAEASVIAPLAEGLLIRMVARLRSLAAAPGAQAESGALSHLRTELAEVRAELAQARAQVQSLSEERERLRKQLDEQRQTAERTSAAARDREQRLRSTVTALEVTRELHQGVMTDLEQQLGIAQQRVEGMEHELTGVRGELKDARTGIDERSRDLHDEMRRLVEMRAMLEARRQELGANLRDAETQLASAAPGTDADNLSAKVVQLRTLVETTTRRLNDQESQAKQLETELAASRNEASELRTRSDSLTGDLDEARSGLAQARRRVEELHRAYSRLESEREELQAELVNRKGTDVIEQKDADSSDRLTQSPSSRMDKVLTHLESRLGDATRKAESLQVQLAEERDRAQALGSEHRVLASRVEELTADRDHVRTELDRLHSEHFSEHSQHAAQIAVATQSSIESERRYKEAMQKVFALENRLAELDPIADPDEEQSKTTILRRELIQALEDRDSALLEVETNRGVVPSTPATVPTSDQLALIEAELASTATARDDLQNRLVATIGERDRIDRELSRMRNEQESAAVEHRTALKSARDRLTETQARVVTLEHELDTARSQVGAARTGTESRNKAEQVYIQSLENRLADALVEHEQLDGRVHQLERDLAIARDATTHGRDGRAYALNDAAEHLRLEQARVADLTRSADQARNAYAAAEDRANRAQLAQLESTAERDRLHLEVSRLTAEVSRLTAKGGAEDRLVEVMADRDHLLAELERTTGELTDLRRRLARAEREGVLAGRIHAERGHVRQLDDELQASSAIRNSELERVAELSERLAIVTLERDELAAEVERLRQAPVADAVLSELTDLRARLVKAKKRIRLLRQQRDAARLGEDAVTRETLAMASDLDREHTTALRAAPRKPADFIAAPDQSGAGRVAFAPTEASPAGGIGLTRRIPSDRITQGVRNTFSPGPRIAVFAPGTSGMRLPQPVTQITSRTRPPPPPFDPRLLTSRAAAPIGLRLRPWLPLAIMTVAGIGALGLIVAVVSQVPPAGTGEVWAHVQPISAPIAGTVTFTAIPGQNLRAGEQIAMIRNLSVDRSAQDALLAKRSALEAKRASLASELETLSLPIIVTEVAPTPDTSLEVEALRNKQRQRQDRLNAIALESSTIADRLVAIGPEIAAEERRLIALSEARISIHFDSQIQRNLVTDGQVVSQGADMILVAEPASLIINATLGDLRRDAAGPGDLVFVSIGDGAALRGMIKTVEAADQAAQHGIKLRIEVPELVGRTDLIGHRARLILLGTAPNPLTKALGHLRAW